MWTTEQFLVSLDTAAWDDAVERLSASLFRLDFSRPGFALLDSAPMPATDFRRLLIQLASDLSARFMSEHGRTLEVISVNRFDQQATTRPHLDGAPVESFLLLGYEPTRIASRLAYLDYSRFAHDIGQTARQFLDGFNPWSAHELPNVDRYVTVVTPFTPTRHQVLLVNNSRAEFGKGQQGVMHQADILNPDPAQSRVINSIVLAVPDAGDPPRPSAEQLACYVADGTPTAG